MKKIILATTALIAGAHAISAAAQERSNTAPAVASTDDGAAGALNEIIVTAQRRGENLQRAAIAVSAISADALVSANVVAPSDLAKLVPSLQTTVTAGPYALFFLRGIGTYTGNTLSDSPVSLNYNGVYIGRTSGASGFFFDLDRVEVVKGPQGTLYGRNTTGGAINLIPTAPVLGEYRGYATLAYGNFDAAQVNAAINLPVSSTVAVRVAGQYATHDAYLNDGTDDLDERAARISLLAQPSDDLRATLVLDYSHDGGTGVGAVVTEQGPSNRWGLNSTQAAAWYRSHPNVIAGRTFDAYSAAPLFQDNRQIGISANLEWTNPLGTLVIAPAYRDTHNDFLTDAPGFYLNEDQRFRQTSIETRLASNGDAFLSYVAGVYYFHETGDDEQGVNAQSQTNPQTFAIKTDSVAGFGELTFAVTDNLKFVLGGRYTQDRKDFNGSYYNVTKLCLGAITPPFTGACPLYTAIPYGTVPSLTFPPGSNAAIPQLDFVQGTITTGNIINPDRHQTYSKSTYKIGASWQATPENLVYANYSTGYKSGGFFFSNDSGTYLPETIGAWTIGSKNRFFNDLLQLNLEGFYYKYSNEQVSHVTQDSTGATIFATENVGKATFQGVEAEVQLRPIPSLLLAADVQYLDAVYDRFQYNVPLSLAPSTVCTQAPNAAFTLLIVDCSGKRPVNAPLWTIGLSAEKTFTLSSDAHIVVGGRLHYQSETATGLEFTPVEMQKAYALGDLYFRFEGRKRQFSLEGFVNNVGNETVITNSAAQLYGTFTVAPLKPPRTYGVRASYKF